MTSNGSSASSAPRSQFPRRPTSQARCGRACRPLASLGDVAGWCVALALLAVVLVGLAASPARTAILRFFGIGAVRIELVDRLPAVEPSAPIAAGRRIAATETPFRLLRSDLLGEPDRLYADGEVVTLLYGSPERVRLLVTQIGTAELTPELVKKLATVSTDIRVGRARRAPRPRALDRR